MNCDTKYNMSDTNPYTIINVECAVVDLLKANDSAYVIITLDAIYDKKITNAAGKRSPIATSTYNNMNIMLINDGIR